MINMIKKIFHTNSKFSFVNNFKFVGITPNKQFGIFYNLNKFNFARNVKSSKKVSIDHELNQDFKNPSANSELNLENNYTPSKTNYESEEIIPLDAENITLMIDKFHYRGKLFQIESKKQKFNTLEEYVDYYNYLISNLNKLHYFQLEKFLRAICYFQVKDEKTKDLLSRYLNSQPNNTHSALFVVYFLKKLEMEVEDLEKKSLKIISDNGIVNSDKLYVIPFIWAISEMQMSQNEVNEKIDEFIREQINFMNEYETSILLRFYSKLFYYNYDMLEIVIKRCLHLSSYFSLRYILIISKCLAEMKIKNLNLLTGLQERLFQIIKMNSENPEDENYLTADYLAQILSNFVKIEFFDFVIFNQIENLFFELAEKQGISNKETIYCILSSHCVFIRKIYQEINLKKGVSDNNENKESKGKSSSIKVRKEYKQINEQFYERFLPHLMKFQNDMNFQTVSNIVVLIKNSHLTKRRCLRLVQEFYLNSIDKYLNPTSIKEIDNHKRVDEFIKMGLKMCEMESVNKSIMERLEHNSINCQKYYDFIEKDNNFKQKQIINNNK